MIVRMLMDRVAAAGCAGKFLRLKSLRPWLLGGGLAAGVAIAATLLVATHVVDERRKAGADLVRLRLTARVNAYGRQLEDLTDRIDQMGQRLMAEWRAHPAQIDFDNILVGMYPRSKPLYVAIYDDKAQLVAASFAARRDGDLRPIFIEHHRAHCCDGWHVTPAAFSAVADRKILQLSHRLSHDDGSFAGALAISMTPDFLMAFEDDSVIGRRDFVSVRMIDGPMLTTKLGAGQAPQVFYKAPPSFDTAHGIRLEPADRFRDGTARWVAWRKHPGMPLVAVATLAEADAMADIESAVAAYQGSAAIVIAGLLLLYVGVLVAAARLAVRREADEEVRQIYRAATDASNEGFYMLRPVWDGSGQLADFRFEDINACGAYLMGRERGQLLKKPASTVLQAPVFHDVLELVRKALVHQVADDERRVASAARLPSKWLYRRAVQVGTGVALTLRDISDAKAHEEALLELAHRDVLTGLPNRLWLLQYMPTAIRRARRAHRQLAVLFVDLDHFKTVNDTLGHDAGDALLRQVTEQLRSTLRASDRVVRLGGDEFLVVIEKVDEPETLDALATKIISSLNHRFAPMDGPLNLVSASIGISLFPRDGERPDELLKHADIAMYQSKNLGRGRHCWYTADLSSQLAERIDIEQALRKALERDELDLYYQPKFHAHSGQLSGVEALLRWQRPERGLVMPDAFIGLAESTGLIVPVGGRVIRQVVAQMAHWQGAGLPPIRVAINVSPEQLRRSDVAAQLQQQLQEHGIDASQIDIEITESAMVEQSDAVQSQLAQLRALGVRLFIDDFGAGYSSLSQLQRLDADGLKVDRGLVARLLPGSDIQSLCQGIVWMAAALGLKVVAEGVETAEQLAVLRQIGCDELQGYLLSEPLDAEALEHVLRQARIGQVGVAEHANP